MQLCQSVSSDCVNLVNHPLSPSITVSPPYSLTVLPGGIQMVDSVRQAQHIIKQYEKDGDVIELRFLLTLHTTLNYFCCHTPKVGARLEVLQYTQFTTVLCSN